MNDRLLKIYNFLQNEENKKYNRKVQNLDFEKWGAGCQYNNQFVFSVFWHCANTQSSPRINLLTHFAEKFKKFNDRYADVANNPFPLGVFFKELFPVQESSELLDLAKYGSGWGPKTSALLFKSLRVAARCNSDIFDMNSMDIIAADRNSMIPVDSVIKHIFVNNLKFECSGNYFDKINKFLLNCKDQFDPESSVCEFVDVWDELWFWGFITQSSQNGVRVTAWNRPKLFSISPLLFSNQEIDDISEKSFDFIDLLTCD